MRWSPAAARPRSSWERTARWTTSLSGWVSAAQPAGHLEPTSTRMSVSPLNSRLWLEQIHLQSAALAPLRHQGPGRRHPGADQGQRAKGGFDQGDLDLLVAFADQAAIAIENARLYEEAQQVAASQERSRLARDLHDAVTQTLFSASLIAEVLPALWENDPAEGRELLGELRQLTRGALAEMRTLLLELRPVGAHRGRPGRPAAPTGRVGLGPHRHPGRGCARRAAPLPDLPDEVHVALYRIAQEALNNVVKHAQAKQAEVRLKCARETGGDAGPGEIGPVRVVLTISDDGRGFDPATVSPEHLGLGIIRERAQAIGAALRIESEPGAGTRLRWCGMACECSSD